MTEQAAPAAETTETTTAVPVTPAASTLISAATEVKDEGHGGLVAPVRPDNLSDAYWDAATGVKPEAFARLAELEAAQEAANAGRVAAWTDYKLETAEPIEGPDGKPVAFDPNDPLAQAILPELHAAGLSQESVGKVLGAYARLVLDDAKAQAEFEAAERAKLGAGHEARTGALHAQITARIGAEGAEALRQTVTSADAVIALEALLKGSTGPVIGAAPAPDPNADLQGLSGADLISAIRQRENRKAA